MVIDLSYSKVLHKSVLLSSKNVALLNLTSLIVKMQNICNLIGWKSVHISDILIATVPISMERETQESEAGYAKHLNLY